jgi:peptide deformylase
MMLLNNLNPKLIVHPQDDVSVLQKESELVDNPSVCLLELRELVRQMDKIMSNSNGIGLAAPQVGIPIRLFIMNTGNGLTAYVNPVIIRSVGSFTSIEGCLSFPGMKAEILRAKLVKIRAFDILQGKEVTVKYRGLDSACAQHEIDHLDGYTFSNLLTRLKM